MRQMKCVRFIPFQSPFLSLFVSVSPIRRFCLCLLILWKNVYDCTRQTAFIINCKRSSVDLSKYAMHGKVKLSLNKNAIVTLMCISLITVKTFMTAQVVHKREQIGKHFTAFFFSLFCI